MELIQTSFKDLLLLKPLIFDDSRGFFYESYNKNNFNNLLKKKIDFCQDNHSFSKKGVIRGLHFQIPPFVQVKLIRVCKGEIYDVVVDLRKHSETYGKYFATILSSKNKLQLFVPEGFAHGFQVLSRSAEIIYKVNKFYSPTHERHIHFNDPFLKVEWPIKDPIISKKDNTFFSFKDSYKF